MERTRIDYADEAYTRGTSVVRMRVNIANFIFPFSMHAEAERDSTLDYG